MRANLRLETVRNIAHELKLKEDQRKIIYETINMLNSSLIAAETNIESVMKKKESNCVEAHVNRWKYMLTRQSIVD